MPGDTHLPNRVRPPQTRSNLNADGQRPGLSRDHETEIPVTVDLAALKKLSDANRERILEAGDPEAIRRREELEQLRTHIENLEHR